MHSHNLVYLMSYKCTSSSSNYRATSFLSTREAMCDTQTKNRSVAFILDECPNGTAFTESPHSSPHTQTIDSGVATETSLYQKRINLQTPSTLTQLNHSLCIRLQPKRTTSVGRITIDTCNGLCCGVSTVHTRPTESLLNPMLSEYIDPPS
ncbi:hypothetical protein FRC19_000793 [Serendipita sp. 401]|nr:hypothetical protein FRC19_000793 [Serendipita sp. 401]